MTVGVYNRRTVITELVADALRAFTLDAAYLAHEEHLKGSLTPGKLADFVVLDRDPLAVSPEEIKDIQVDQTVVGGEVIYQGGRS